MTIRYIGNTVPVAQVDTITPANVEITDIFYLTVTGQDGRTVVITFVATVATVANVTAGMTAAWNASEDPLCTGITAADGTTEMTLTADTPGEAFSVASTELDGGGVDDQTFTLAATTANAGPKNWNDTENWSGGAVPGGAGSQDVFVEDAVLLYNLDQSGIANALDSLTINNSQIGQNPAAGCLPVFLQIKATIVNIGLATGPGTTTQAAPINIDTGSTASTITVFNTGTNSDSTQPAVRLIANSVSTDVHVKKGKAGIAFDDGNTATVGDILITYDKNKSGDADVFIGEGVTLTNLTEKGGECSLRSAVATLLSLEAGRLYTLGSGTIATMTQKGGSSELNSTGTITALNVLGGTADFTKSAEARIVTTAKLDKGGTLKYDPAKVTMTNQVQPYNASGDITFQAA